MDNTIQDVWNDSNRHYPSIVYVETVNICNAKCICCLNHRCQRIRGIMTLDDFKIIADKVKAKGLQIGAMFCFGEPLIDPTLFEKFEYAKKIQVMPGHVGFNTNVTFLTEEKYEKICRFTPNIILSFFNVEKEYERLTGGLSWEQNYKKAIDFIKFRDAKYPHYPIFISVNKVEGHNLEAVKNAFKHYNIVYVQDAELRWGGKVITGVVDRMIMFPNWRCDGHKGALQVKWNGNCEFCAYDIIGTEEGVGETFFANILTDSWDDIERKFKDKWKEPNSLCKRCDYFYLCKRVIANNYKYVEDTSWQLPYIIDGRFER